MVVNSSNPSILETETSGSLEFEASLVHESSGQQRIHRETLSQNKMKTAGGERGSAVRSLIGLPESPLASEGAKHTCGTRKLMRGHTHKSIS